MTYKKSRYNVIIEYLENGNALIYNTYSGFYGIMDVKTQRIYEQIENIEISNFNDKTVLDNIEIMHQHGYIVDSSLDELATFKMERLDARIKGHVLCLTIAPTMACNMRCPYCYETKTGKTMDESTQKQLIQFVESHFIKYPELKRLTVTWYGGEPLLQKAIIYNLSKQLIDLSNRYNVSYDAAIITNGSLLDRDTAIKLRYECSVLRAQITIDGMPDTHNKRRILVNGMGSFEIIIRNIENCRSFMNIAVRMNVDKTNNSDIAELLQLTTETLNWKNNPKLYLAPVDSYTENCTHSAPICFARPEFAEINIAFQKMNYAINRNNIKSEFYPSRMALHCGAERNNSYVIDPEGYYYNCWMLIGNCNHRTGHISKPFIYTNQYYKWLSNDFPSKCEACEYLPMCAGGCGYFRIIKGGEPNCITTYYSYKETLRLAYKDYLSQKNR